MFTIDPKIAHNRNSFGCFVITTNTKVVVFLLLSPPKITRDRDSKGEKNGQRGMAERETERGLAGEKDRLLGRRRAWR